MVARKTYYSVAAKTIITISVLVVSEVKVLKNEEKSMNLHSTVLGKIKT